MCCVGLFVVYQGYLVQIFCYQVVDVVEQGIDVIIVFIFDKVWEVFVVVVKVGRVQFVLFKVYSDDDFFYLGQESGFVQYLLYEVVVEIKKLLGLYLVGFIYFFCLFWDEVVGKVLLILNFYMLIQVWD